MVFAADKEATGPMDDLNLASRASRYLAMISNSASVYENQLGIRLLVQELILIPDDNQFNDIPAGNPLVDFKDWMLSHRPTQTYRWTLATRMGTGFTGVALGEGYVGALNSIFAVCTTRTGVKWDVMAHEMGHNLGSNHSAGGVMNASSLGGNTRDFFRDVTAGETSAKDIYDFARARLLGPAEMRHPEEMPFARNESVSTDINVPVRFPVLENDEASVRNGAINGDLSLVEVGRVMPLHAGTAEVRGDEVLFTPADRFEGFAWFSYTVKGDIGNANRGWYHKGDVAVRVGDAGRGFTLTLPAGGSYSFEPAGGTLGLTQPAHALVDVSNDNPRLLIIRADAFPGCVDTFETGGDVYTIRYTQDSPVTRPDIYLLEPGENSITFDPLSNDQGAGERWLGELQTRHRRGNSRGPPHLCSLLPHQFSHGVGSPATTYQGNSQPAGTPDDAEWSKHARHQGPHDLRGQRVSRRRRGH